MFKINPSPTFTCQVQLTVPGQAELASIEVEFRHMSRPALKAWLEGGETKSELEFVGAAIAGWNGIADDDGELTYSESSLERLLNNYPAAAGELVNAYLRALKESRIKN